MKQDLDRFSVGSHDNHLTDSAVQRFRGFVGSFFGLLEWTKMNSSISLGRKEQGRRQFQR